MIDRATRRQLAECLELLVGGEMTNDQFDELYDDRWSGSDDAAVREIATFGWSLYSSGLPMPYRLRGRHAVGEEVRLQARRACLFLQTDREYEWPVDVRGVIGCWEGCLLPYGPGCWFVFGLAALVIALVGQGLASLLWLLAAIPGLLGLPYWLITRPEREAEVERFLQAGDHDAWPFLRRADLAQAQGEREPASAQDGAVD